MQASPPVLTGNPYHWNVGPTTFYLTNYLPVFLHSVRPPRPLTNSSTMCSYCCCCRCFKPSIYQFQSEYTHSVCACVERKRKRKKEKEKRKRKKEKQKGNPSSTSTPLRAAPSFYIPRASLSPHQRHDSSAVNISPGAIHQVATPTCSCNN